ncbi:hypothetical protein NLG97_g5147 [Lecanicillium saksenae]|uniref:Uncharacterized protein n=1 Tax=Lecanicillium saksenae TaxID=468837 RepID=A0ACC1QVV0_9HYPO|nr:hypothetical protein NLG97_g5147 [Lecanicillium saksenae]
MEKPSPATSISPSTASGSSNPPAQPTYTTAGTIYNPSSCQPLQPPTRRGRSSKWTTGGTYPDLSLLPRSLLASLQAKSTGRSSPYQAAQYAPLQQNYDRAANPVTRNGYIDDGMAGRRTGSPTPEAEDLMAYIASDRDHDGDDEDEDDDGSDNIMQGLTVKSLHNLASYPNPIQKKAQRALLRPVRPRVNAPAASGDTVFRSLEQRYSPDTGFTDVWFRPRLSNSDSVASQLMAKAELQSITERGQYEVQNPALDDDIEQNTAWLANLALGAPRPLTAGPPGQRQYRASTFKSTFKALNTDVKAGKQIEQDEAYAITAQVLQHAGIDDDAGGKLEGSLSRHGSEASYYMQPFQGSQTLQAMPPNVGYGSVGSHDKTNGGDVEFAAPVAAARPEWGMPASCAAVRSPRNPEYEASFAAYMEKMNKLWYHGCETLCKEDGNKGGDACVGVIGDRRPGHGNRHEELKVAEANKMSAADYAKPLLDMVMANLERSLKELKKQGAQ